MKKLETTNMDISLIGYTQAGKTTLAVGLFATSTEDFTVSGKGEDTDNYLRDRKASLETGHWLEATTENQMPDLCLTINRIGKAPVNLHFKEYMGERACNVESYKRDVVGNPRAVVILLNPCMSILRDPFQRNAMICQLKEIINYLAEPGMRCEYIAFAITASDMLSTSLSGFREEFESYKSEITNFLNTSVFRDNWKEFAVTVSGELEDPTRPRLAKGNANNSREPFVWLIQSLEAADDKSKMKRLLKYLSISASIVLFFGSMFGSCWYFWWDREAERQISAIMDAGGNKLEDALRKGKASEINAALSNLEIGRKQQTARHPFFERNKKRYDCINQRLIEQIEHGRIVWFPMFFEERTKELIGRIDETRGLSPEKCRKALVEINEIGERFAEFRPSCDSSQEGFSNVKKTWEDAKRNTSTTLEKGCEKYFASRFAIYSDIAKSNATVEVCQQWRSEISSWDPITSEGKAVRDKVLEAFDGNLKNWRTAYESWVYSEGCNKLLETLRFVSHISDETATEFHKSMVDCRQYEKLAMDEDAAELVDWETRKRVWEERIKPRRQLALDALREAELKRLDPKAQDCPYISENTWTELDQMLKDDDALSESDYEAWKKELEKGVEGRQQEWRQVQRRKCESFVEDIEDDKLEGPDILRAFQNFYSDNPNNPSLPLAVKGVHKRIGIAFSQVYDDVYFEFSKSKSGMSKGDIMARVESGVRRLRELCRALNRVKYEPLKNSCWYKLAIRCLNEGKIDQGISGCFPQTLTVSRVDARICYYPHGPLGGNFPVSFESMDVLSNIHVLKWSSSGYQLEQNNSVCSKSFYKNDNFSWRTVYKGGQSYKVNPFSIVQFSITGKDLNRDSLWKVKESSNSFSFYTLAGGRIGSTDLVFDKVKGCFSGVLTVNVSRISGDSDPTVEFKIYLSASGEDLRDWWPSSEERKFKLEEK